MSDVNPPEPTGQFGELEKLFSQKGTGGAHVKFDPKAGGGGMGSFRKYFGEAGYKKFVSMLNQSIVQQIAKDKQKAKETSDRLKRAEEGKDMYD